MSPDIARVHIGAQLTTPTSRQDAATAGPAAHRRAGLALTVILTCQLMVVLDGSIVNIALPQMRTSLGFSPESLSWVLNAYMLTFGGLLLLGARAGDLLGRRRVFIAGIALFTLASLLGGFAQTAAELLAARAAQGVGGAFASPAALALLMSRFPEGRERVRAIGLYTAVSVGGGALGLIVGGALVEWTSWRWVMFVNAPIGAAVMGLAGFALEETERRRGAFDFVGAVTSTVGVTALVYGFVRAGGGHWSDRITVGAFAAGVVLVTWFILNERRAAAPITPLRLFANRNRSTAYLGRLFLVAGMNGMFFFLTQFLQMILGYSPLRTGEAFLPITIALFAASQVGSRVLIERFGAKPLMIVGIAMSASGFLWLTQLSATSPYVDLLCPLVLCGIGNGLGFVPLTTAALSGVADEDAGAGSGLVNVMQQVGGALGLAVLVTVFGAAQRHAAHHPPAGLAAGQLAGHAFVAGADRAFEVATAFILLTLLLVSVAIRGIPRPGHPSVEQRLYEDLETAGTVSPTASG